MGDETERIKTLRLLVSEIGAEVRSRREPEHLFTAALLGGLGAVGWGVAALANFPAEGGIFHPVLAGALVAILMTLSVTLKVVREHWNYRTIRKEQIDLISLLRVSSGIEDLELPSGLREKAKTSGAGVWWSLGICWASALGIVVFCVVISVS